MAVIGVYSAKGGVGKTTIAVDLAWRSAMHGGHRTLLWDLDHQGGSAFLLGLQRRELLRASSIFQREGRPGALIEPTAWRNLSVLQADDSLRGLGVTLARIGNKRRLAQIVALLKGQYDRIVLDCPPMFSEVSDQILNAADLLIVPVPASPMAQRSFDMVLDEVRQHRIRNLSVLPVLSMYSAGRELHRDVRKGRAAGWPAIPLATEIEHAAQRRKPIGAIASESRADRALHRLWKGIEAKIDQRGLAGAGAGLPAG